MLTYQTFITLLGKLPAKASPNPIVVEEVDCGTYMRQTIEYAVEPKEHIRAYLCLPHKRTHPLPALYCFHQHAGNRLLGKSEVVGLVGDPDQVYAHELAERGFITLAPDAICFEDRCADKESPDYAHVHELHQRLIRGQTLLGKVLHDVSAGIDLLEAHLAVDRSRIGFIGHSYGGRMALFAPAFDRRIKASVCNGGSINFRDMDGIQFDFVVPNFLRYGDIEDVVCLTAPTNLLILGGDSDKWSIGLDAIIDYAKPAFEKGSLKGEVYTGGHQFTPEMRESAYSFLEKHLKHEGNAPSTV